MRWLATRIVIKYIDKAKVAHLQNNQIHLNRHDVITTNWNEVGTSLYLKAALVLFSPASLQFTTFSDWFDNIMFPKCCTVLWSGTPGSYMGRGNDERCLCCDWCRCRGILRLICVGTLWLVEHQRSVSLSGVTQKTRSSSSTPAALLGNLR